MSEMTIRDFCIATCVFTLMVVIPVARGQSFPDLNRIFKDGDFRPYVPSIRELRKKYGPGQTINANGDAYLAYKAGPHRWVNVAYDSTIADPDVQEIIYTSDVSCHACNLRTQIAEVDLYGVGIGDVQEKVRSLHTYKCGQIVIRGHFLKFLEFKPIKGEADLFARYYIEGGKVVAVSIGVTE